jgi:hypothetical protein
MRNAGLALFLHAAYIFEQLPQSDLVHVITHIPSRRLLTRNNLGQSYPTPTPAFLANQDLAREPAENSPLMPPVFLMLPRPTPRGPSDDLMLVRHA